MTFHNAHPLARKEKFALNYESIIYEKADKIARITLNRPEVLNALNGQMLRELPEATGEASRDDDVRAVVITGSGRGFCAGGDHRHIETQAASSEGLADFSFSEKVIL